MRASRALGLVAAVLMVTPVLLLAQAGAGEGDESLEPDEGVKRVVMKRYITLGALAAWQAAGEDVRVDVRFEDEFKQIVVLRPALREVRLGEQRVPIAGAFTTGSDLWCLAPVGADEVRETVRRLSRGQHITVEGTIAGVIAGYKCVVVDRVLTGAEKQSVIEHELLVRWPRRPDLGPRRIVKPGEYEVEFPCSWQEGEVETVGLVVERRSRQRFMEELKKLRAGAEGEETEEKIYDLYNAPAVLNHARENNQLDVRFEERIKGRVPPSPALRQVRLNDAKPVRIGYAFETHLGITCLVPAYDDEMVERASRAISGQEVTIRGTILGQMGVYRVVLVDEIEFPTVKGVYEAPDMWVVSILWGEAEPLLIWRAGRYTRSFPCAFVENRPETIEFTLQEVRLVPEKKEEAEDDED